MGLLQKYRWEPNKQHFTASPCEKNVVHSPKHQNYSIKGNAPILLAQVCLLCPFHVGVNKHQVFCDSQWKEESETAPLKPQVSRRCAGTLLQPSSRTLGYRARHPGARAMPAFPACAPWTYDQYVGQQCRLLLCQVRPAKVPLPYMVWRGSRLPAAQLTW